MKSVQLDSIHNIVIPDGVDGERVIDSLFLTEYGIILIEKYQTEGHLYGSEEIDMWTQIVRGRSYQFTNPLHHIHTSRQALANISTKVNIHTWVVLCAKADFPKGQPKDVFLVDDLSKKINQLRKQNKTDHFAKFHWDKITEIAEQYQPQVVEYGHNSER